MRKIILSLLMLSILNLPSARAEETVPGGQALPPGMDAAKMAEVKLKGAPNENHKVLDAFAGDWNYTSTMRMTPDAQPMEMKGTTSSKWILDGRFLQGETKGEWMGEPFNGIAIAGYDNVKEEYNSLWIDNMATGMMVSSGKYDPATKTITEEGTFSCPMTGKKDMAFRSELKSIDADNYTYSMYQKAEDGTEFKGMEITYTRA